MTAPPLLKLQNFFPCMLSASSCEQDYLGLGSASLGSLRLWEEKDCVSLVDREGVEAMPRPVCVIGHNTEELDDTNTLHRHPFVRLREMVCPIKRKQRSGKAPWKKGGNLAIAWWVWGLGKGC